MQSFISDKPMMITRRTAINTDQIMAADRITVDKYTATCQKTTQKGALFLLDQYLDQAYPMNREGSNRGGYEASDLRKTLQSDEVLDIFADYRSRMRPFGNGDLLRLPFHSEIFGNEGAERFEPDHYDQWPLMKDRNNQIALRDDKAEWGWIQNKHKWSMTDFCIVLSYGIVGSCTASNPIGVRPVFLIV